MRALRGIDLLAMREHFSVSFLNTMLSCSMRGVLGSTLRLTPCREQSSPALLKGNIFHKTMEFYFLTLKRKDFTLSSLELFKESMVKAIAHYKKKGKFYKKEVLAAAIQYFEDNVKLAKVMSEFLEKKYYQKARTSDAVIEVEIPFTKVPMFEHLFTGRIDLLFNAEVTDFKTVGQAISKDDPVKYAEKVEKLRADFAMQLLIYDEAMTYLIGNKSKATSTLELILPKSYTILETVVTKNPTVTEYTFTQEELQQSKEELQMRVNLTKQLLRDRTITRNFKDTFCPCEYSGYCLDESKLKMVLSKTNVPENIF